MHPNHVDPRPPSVPLPPLWDSPSTRMTTTRQVRLRACTTTIAEDPCSASTKFHYHRPRRHRIHQVPLQNVNHYLHNDVCTTTVDLEDPVDVKFLAVTPNIYGMCTTTKRVPLLPLPSRERLRPLRHVNNYFHFERVPPRMHASKV